MCPQLIKPREFRRTIAKEIPPLFEPLGFMEIEPGAFARKVDNILHGFGFMLSTTRTCFVVMVGLDVPALWPKLDHIGGGRSLGFLVSHRLGTFVNNMRGRETWYGWVRNEQLPELLHKVRDDFEAQALPWLAQFNSVLDVAREYYRFRVKVFVTGEVPYPAPFEFAYFGWLLEAAGETIEAKAWLQRAAAEAMKSIYRKDNRVVVRWEPGAVEIPKDEYENRLAELLREYGTS